MLRKHTLRSIFFAFFCRIVRENNNNVKFHKFLSEFGAFCTKIFQQFLGDVFEAFENLVKMTEKSRREQSLMSGVSIGFKQ